VIIMPPHAGRPTVEARHINLEIDKRNAHPAGPVQVCECTNLAQSQNRHILRTPQPNQPEGADPVRQSPPARRPHPTHDGDDRARASHTTLRRHLVPRAHASRRQPSRAGGQPTSSQLAARSGAARQGPPAPAAGITRTATAGRAPPPGHRSPRTADPPQQTASTRSNLRHHAPGPRAPQ